MEVRDRFLSVIMCQLSRDKTFFYRFRNIPPAVPNTSFRLLTLREAHVHCEFLFHTKFNIEIHLLRSKACSSIGKFPAAKSGSFAQSGFFGGGGRPGVVVKMEREQTWQFLFFWGWVGAIDRP